MPGAFRQVFGSRFSVVRIIELLSPQEEEEQRQQQQLLLREASKTSETSNDTGVDKPTQTSHKEQIHQEVVVTDEEGAEIVELLV